MLFFFLKENDRKPSGFGWASFFQGSVSGQTLRKCERQLEI
jgi:hypothetical protein